MNIDQRCYGYEPAESELRALRNRLTRLEAENTRLVMERDAAIKAYNELAGCDDSADIGVANIEPYGD